MRSNWKNSKGSFPCDGPSQPLKEWLQLSLEIQEGHLPEDPKWQKKRKNPCSLPGPPKGCFFEVFGYIKATKKQPFGGAGVFFVCFTRAFRFGCFEASAVV